MRRRLIVATLLGGSLLAAGVAQERPGPPSFDAAERQTEFSGPGREEPEPSGLTEVRVGWFGPSDPRHADGDLWLAASLAIEEANAAGGYEGLSFRLVPAWSDSPWTAGASHVARMVFEERVWALIGSVDGPSTHLAEQVVVKAWVTQVNPAATDRSIHMANVPWMFSIPPADDLLAAALAPAVARGAGGRPFAVLSCTDHDSRLTTSEVRDALSDLGASALHHFEIPPGGAGLGDLADRIAGMDVGTMIVIAGAADSARIVAALRARRAGMAIFGGPSMQRRAFIELAGTAAEGVVFPLTCDPGMSATPFARRFASRFDRSPDCVAAQAYDAASLLIAAVRKAGLNRALVRDAVQALSPWAGASGGVRFNRLNQNERPPTLATVRAGRITPL